MISNERQYKITKAALGELDTTLRALGKEQALAEAGGDEILAKALIDSLTSERDALSQQVKEYEMLKLGLVKTLKASTLSELPELLVKARIAKGLSQKDLAIKLGLKEQQIQRYEAARYYSASLKKLIEVSDALGLEISEKVRLEASVPEPTSTIVNEAEWAKWPLKEMYRRAWFKGFTGNLKDAEGNASSLIREFIAPVGARAIAALNRQHVRVGSTFDPFSLYAWQYRVLSLAGEQRIRGTFHKDIVTREWLTELTQFSSKEKGPSLVGDFLRDAGIALVIEPHLRKTYLDGAAFWIDGGFPVIGMTIRYDRLDNFWFVLCHEIAHLILHLNSDVDVCLDDIDASADSIEKEADEFACDALIPPDEWETAVTRYIRTEESVKEFASALKIHPALVAGRIRKEAENYVILSDIIGTGEVRCLFPEAKFGL